MLRFKFIHREGGDEAEVSATPKRDMRFFLQDTHAAATAHDAAKAPAMQPRTDKPVRSTSTAAPAAAAKPVTITKVTVQERRITPAAKPTSAKAKAVEPEPPTLSNGSLASLALVEDEFDAHITSINARGVRSGYNPYESGCLVRKSEAKKKPTDLRALSKWIEQTRQLSKQN